MGSLQVGSTKLLRGGTVDFHYGLWCRSCERHSARYSPNHSRSNFSVKIPGVSLPIPTQQLKPLATLKANQFMFMLILIIALYSKPSLVLVTTKSVLTTLILLF